MNNKNKSKGFTLVEIIVVLVIIAIMAAIVVPAVMGYIDDAKDSEYIAEARSVLLVSNAEAIKLKADNQLSEDSLKNKTEAITAKANVDGSIVAITADEASCDYFVYKAAPSKWVKYTKKGNKMEILNEYVDSIFTDANLMNTFFDLFLTLNIGDMDSTASTLNGGEGSKNYQLLKAALAEKNIDLDNLGSTYWYFKKTSNSGYVFYWTTQDISTTTKGTTVPIMKYNSGNGYYTVWNGVVKEATPDNRNGDSGIYNIVRNGSSNSEPSQELPASKNSNKTYETALSIFENALNNK